MTHPSFPLALMLTATIAIAASIGVGASDPVLPPEGGSHVPHIRSAEPRLRALIDDGIDSSATVRALVDRIATSDVVVFVVCERDPAVRASGRLNFMTSAGGLRYLVIRLKPTRRAAAIALLAHELRHAAEIADTLAIVDEESLAREYARIGYRSQASHGGLAFDTKAAVETGRRVLDELIALKSSAGG